MQKSLKQTLVWTILACFVLTLAPLTAVEAKNNGKAHWKHDAKHERFVIQTVRIQERHLSFVRKNRLTLRDLIVAKAIADESRRLDTEDVLRMIQRGKSYKSIARQYNIRWSVVERRLDDVQTDMRREAIRIGITLWALDEILN